MSEPGSGLNANTTISHPGPHWQMFWGNSGWRNFQLDIVGFLAVLGEGSVTANAQVSALSTLFYLPRLIPAPQALLWPTRPRQLGTTAAKVTGVESGISKDHVHHVAHVLLGDEMDKFTVRCVQVTKPRRERVQTWKDRMFRGEPRPRNGDSKMEEPVIKARANGPTSWVTLLSFLLSIAMLINSFLWGDGMSLIATLSLSFLSTLIGIVNKWNLELSKRPQGAISMEKRHVVIRYPNGSFLIVKCNEEIARELYFAPEEIKYNVENVVVYRLSSLLGTLMLMGGVVTLANAKLQLQFAWMGAYIITNAAHFLAAAVPPRLHWDLSCYELKEQSIAGGPVAKTFTDALWKAIVFTKRTDWIRKNEAAPQTKVWDQWIEEADRLARTSHFVQGRLINPKRSWGKGEGDQGVVWHVPDAPADWDAKAQWDQIEMKSTMEAGESLDSRAPTPNPGDIDHGEVVYN